MAIKLAKEGRMTDKSDSKAQPFVLPGDKAFYLYSSYGLPLEVIRDVCGERGWEIDEQGFYEAMEQHRKASGAGKLTRHEDK